MTTFINKQLGFHPASEPKQFMRFAKTAAIIYKGDPVHLDLSAGAAFRSPAAPAVGDPFVGVATEFAAAADGYITVSSDPKQLYHCRLTEADGTVDDYVATTHLGQWHEVAIGGTPVNYQSDMTIDGSTGSVTAPSNTAFVQILGLALVEGNSATGVALDGTPLALCRFAGPGVQPGA